MEKNNRRRFGVLDWVIIVVLLLCVAVFALRFVSRDKISGEELTGKYEISFLITVVRHTTADEVV